MMLKSRFLIWGRSWSCHLLYNLRHVICIQILPSRLLCDFFYVLGDEFDGNRFGIGFCSNKGGLNHILLPSFAKNQFRLEPLSTANLCLLLSSNTKGILLYIHPVGWLVGVTINFPSPKNFLLFVLLSSCFFSEHNKQRSKHEYEICTVYLV